MSAVSQATVSASSPRRGGCAVQLSPQVVNGLSSDLEKLRSSRSTSPREITGLLYGTAEDGLVSVKAFKALSARVSRQRSLDAQVCSATEFESSLAASGNDTSSLQLIGWYCLRLGKNPGLLDSDVEFHNEHFPRRTDLALVLRPEHKTDLVMELYSRTPEGLLSSTEHRWTSLHLPTNVKVDEPIELVMRSRLNDDFYMRAYQVGRSLERAERNEEWKRRIEFGKTITTSLFQGTLGRAAQIQRKARMLIAAPGATESGKSPASSTNAVSLYQRFDPASTGLPAVRSTQKPPIPWFSSAVIFVFVAGACATFSILYIQNRSMAHRGTASQHQESIIPAPILGLHVQTQADRLLVTWNRSSFTARTAGNGVLVIDDGSSHRELPLDSGQVADGSVLYKPGSDDVSFRLELFGDRGSATTESVRVLDGTQTARGESSAPMAATNTSSITSGPREPEQHEATIKTGTNAPFNAAAENESSPSAADELAASETRRTFALQSPVVVRPAVTSATALRPAELPAADTTAQQMVQPLPLPIDTVPPPAPAPQAPPEQPKPALPTGIQAAKQPLPPAAEKSKSIGIYVPPRALKQIMPDRSLTGHGVVTEVTLIEVKVRVDTRGRVKDARVLNKVKANAILGAAAVAAAREWSFAPATLNGNKVESDHTIVFEFRPSGR